MTKRELRTEEILSCALKVWADVPEKQQSLQLVADALGMTKQGLYRYFQNKQDLKDRLHARWTESVIHSRNKTLHLAGLNPLPLKEIIGAILEFLLEQWTQLQFSMQTQLHHPEVLTEALEYYQLLEEKSGVASYKWIWIYNNLLSFLWQKRKEEPNLDFWTEKIFIKVTQGYFSGVIETKLDHKAIENNPLGIIQDEGIGKIDQALLDTIKEKGISHLSLRELAEQAGMGKSSLYNYYDSKQALLLNVMEGLRLDFNRQLDAISSSLERIDEKLYAHILFLSRFIQHHPAVMVLITELKNQLPKDDLCEEDQEKILIDMEGPFKAAAELGLLKEDLLSYRDSMRLLTFCLGADMFLVHRKESPEERALRIYRLFTQGISLD